MGIRFKSWPKNRKSLLKPKEVPIKEKDIELQICRYLLTQNIFFWKQPTTGYFDTKRKKFREQASPFAIRGVADILACVRGRFVAIEVKTRKGAQKHSQKIFEENLTKAGGVYLLARSVEDVKNLLDSLSLGV